MKAVDVILFCVATAVCCSAAVKVNQREGREAEGIKKKEAAQSMIKDSSLQDNSLFSSLFTQPNKKRRGQKPIEKRAVPPVVAEVGTEIITDVVKQAVQKQIQIIEEQQKKAEEFVGKKLELNIEPEKGWETEDMFVPSGVHIDSEYIASDKPQDEGAGEQPFTYPMGIGGMIMNGCYGRDYSEGDPCYNSKKMTTKCLNLIDGAAFIGVGFDGRADYSPESRKMSIVQRVCAGKASYDDADVPDTMNVHGVYDTSTSMHSFYSREEYQTWLQRQAGMAGSYFGFYGGVKKAWGSSSLGGSQKYMSRLSIDIDRYEIYLDEVKPDDLSVNFLQEFMDLPISYLAPGAAGKIQNFILRWGTHYVKSGKFGGRLQIFKTMDASQVSSKEEFSQVMETGFKSLFSSFNAKGERSGGSSSKSQTKTSSTTISVEGGDHEIASIITDFRSPTIKYDLKQWLDSIRIFPKPFKFMVAPITDLVRFNPSSLFPDEKKDWGCEAHKLDTDPADAKDSYYEIKINGTMKRKYCPFKNRDDLAYFIERKRKALERGIEVYMEEGPISASDITLAAGTPGCGTKTYKFQVKAGKPTWNDITQKETPFLVIFDIWKELSGNFNGPVKIYHSMERYAKFYSGEWFVGETRNELDLTSGCNKGKERENKICIFGLVLTYHAHTGFLVLEQEDFNVSKATFPGLTTDMVGSLIAHVEWPSDHIFQMAKAVGYLPCNVEWSNALRFDPSDRGGKCLHFTASSKGNIYVIFAAVPSSKDTWYYVQISPYGVGIFKSQTLVVSTVDISAVGLGDDILYQSYFVCLRETSERTVIEYGKSLGTTEKGDVYLTMIDTEDPLFARFYSFGNGQEPLSVVDAHIISRHLTEANCKGDTGLDVQTNMCVQKCHKLCDPTQGCRGSSGDKPLASNCNACLYVKNAETGECLEACPEDWEQEDNKTCTKPTKPCEEVQCLNGGTCKNSEDGQFHCDCQEGVYGPYCEAFFPGDKSVILGSNKEYSTTLKKFLEPVVQSQSSYWKRCWRASEDGRAGATFHSLCDGKGPTVTIIRVGKYIFGGYTSVSWVTSCGYKSDEKAFVFSLVNKPGWNPMKMQQHRNLYSRYSIYSCLSDGPTFGYGQDLHITDEVASSTSDLGYTYGPSSGYKRGSTFIKTFLAGSYKFQPDEVETFYEST